MQGAEAVADIVCFSPLLVPTRPQEYLKAQGQLSVRKFKKVPKDKKSGLPKKYVAGSKNPDKTRREILNTRRLYKAGKLTPAMMDRISKERSRA